MRVERLPFEGGRRVAIAAIVAARAIGAFGAFGAIGAIAAIDAGCAGPLARGEAAFRTGEYPEAKEALGALEVEARRWPPGERAEYALYRGLTFGALGDVARAGPWLEEAATIARSHPGALSREDERRLDCAVEAAGLR
jgi:hypothetical protein